MLRSRSRLLYLLLIVDAHVTTAEERPRRRLKLTEDEASQPGLAWHDGTVKLRRAGPIDAPEPGDQAAEFRVPTLSGEFVYQPGAVSGGSVVIHAFTNKSAFLECLWSSEASLSSLVEDLPARTQVLFLSLDDSSVTDALWMRERLHNAAMKHSQKEVLSRLHFSPVPVFALGNWIPSVLYYWACTGHNCGLAQAVFTSQGWSMPVIVKRLDARYDWLTARWGQGSYQLRDAGDGCDPSPSVAGSVAWLSEGNCSFFTKMRNMAKSDASGVLVYVQPGSPIRDMNCAGDECLSPLGLPAAMVHLEPSVAHALRFGRVNVSFQTTPSPNFFMGIDQQGAMAEMGWFLYPTFSFVNWQAQWFDFYSDLLMKLESPATVIPVFDKVQMQGDKGAVAVVNLPSDLSDFDRLVLDTSLSCPGRRDLSCAQWDHTVQLFVCCDHLGPFCNVELGRWITAFRRGIGHWQTDVSPLIPVLDANKCTFTMTTVPWAMPWIVSLNLRFSAANLTSNHTEKLRPFTVMSLYSGGTFNSTYNKMYLPIKFPVPVFTKKVELYAVITGHGSDENGCGEFCVTSHHFLFNGVHNNSRTFDSAGSALGCAERVKDGAVPNEHGTWLYGRGGWCDGLQVDPWRVDVTQQLELSGFESNTVVYFGLFGGKDPDPS
ncbi:uncharacterized protein si:dkey-256h2.1 [Entelurus aequoreus]|uniref:uncharacterized protein si:dkey-256h2.1 n=1 Tax=Entelurus aequoreus TaxID=161455 RepID=UPI002B1E3AFF|nr:uncharacterized protein si:dkey-256h2.1 [Entelurus aequoreus]